MGLAFALVAAGLMVSPPEAVALEARERWTWHAPPDCPGGDTVRGEIEAHLGQSL